jgi:hypothetical protein
MDLGVEQVRKYFMRFRFHWDVIRHLQQQYHNGELGRVMAEGLQRVIMETIETATSSQKCRPYHYYQIELDTTHQNTFHVKRLFVHVKTNRTTQVVLFENGDTASMLSSNPAVGALTNIHTRARQRQVRNTTTDQCVVCSLSHCFCPCLF